MPTFNQWLDVNLRQLDREPYFSTLQLVDYFTRFNLEVREITQSLTDKQTAILIEHLYGSGSSYFCDISDHPPSKETEQFFHSVDSLYKNLFEERCSHFYSHLDEGPKNKTPLNGPCYMLWDMDCGIDSFRFSGVPEHINNSIAVLERLSKSKHPATIESAIHGLGHMVDDFRSQCAPILEQVLKRNDLPEELREYADDALNYYIQ